MKYDPIMCMNVPDSVKTKDEAFIIEAKKEGRPYKAIVNGEEKEIEKYYTHKGFTDIKLTKTKGKDSKTIDKAIKTCDIPNIRESLKQDIKSGKITIKQAAIEMYEAGMFNWIPDENEVKRKLGL